MPLQGIQFHPEIVMSNPVQLCVSICTHAHTHTHTHTHPAAYDRVGPNKSPWKNKEPTIKYWPGSERLKVYMCLWTAQGSSNATCDCWAKGCCWPNTSICCYKDTQSTWSQLEELEEQIIQSEKLIQKMETFNQRFYIRQARLSENSTYLFNEVNI